MTRLRTWREHEGLTLDEVAGLTGVSVPMLSMVERSKRRISPRLKVLMARRLGVPIVALFDPEPVPDDALAVAEPA